MRDGVGNAAGPAILHPETAGRNAKRGSDSFFSPRPVFHFSSSSISFYLFILLVVVVVVAVKNRRRRGKKDREREERMRIFFPSRWVALRHVGAGGRILIR